MSLSGGLDSVALAHCLFALKNEEKIADLCFFHANYHLRGHDSDADEKLCRNLARELGIEIVVGDFNLDINDSHIQKNARDLRRRALLEIAEKEARIVAMAHHQDDLFETILFRLFRGANLKTIMPFGEFDGIVWRPLLTIKKLEILNFIKTNQIDYRMDTSNLTDIYTRNYIRHKIIPEISSQFPHAQEKTIQFAHGIQSLVKELMPHTQDNRDVVEIPNGVTNEILKIWLYEHIQKRLLKFHTVSDRSLEKILGEENSFCNISDDFAVRKTSQTLEFIFTQ